MIKDLFKDITKYLPSYIVPVVVSFFSVPIITRLFAPDVYGTYSLVMATITVLIGITSAWITTSLVRFYPVYQRIPRDLNIFKSTIVKLSFLSLLIVTLLSVITLFLVSKFLSKTLYDLMKIGVILFILMTVWNILNGELRARRRAGRYSLSKIWQSIAGILFGISLVLIFNFGIEGLIWGKILCLAMALPVLWKVTFGRVDLKLGKTFSKLSKEIAIYGLPIAAINIATWILSLCDRYIIQFAKGSAQVGLYSASYAISERTIFLFSSLFLIAELPIAYRIWEREKLEESRQFRIKVTRYYLIIVLPAAIGLSVLARPVVSVLTATEYHSAYVIVPLVVFGAFFIGLANRYTNVFALVKKTYVNMFCVLGSAVLNIILNFLFVPKYGYIAAAFTTLVSYAFLLILAIIVSRRYFKWPFPFKSLGNSIIASAIMGVSVYFIGKCFLLSNIMNIIVGILVGLTIYPILLLILKEFTQIEIQTVINIKDKLLKWMHLKN